MIRRYGIAGNQRCLKIADAPVVEPGLWPGFSIAPALAEGRVTLAFDVRIDAKLVRWADGPKADRTWALTVGAPGRREQTFTHLPLAAPEWNGLGEVSFMSDGKTEAIWLFDNVTLTVKRTGNT